MSQFGIDHLTDWFSVVHHQLEHEFNIRLEILFKTGQKRRIRNLGEAAEIPEFFTEVQKKQEQRVGGDGKNLLEYEGRKEPGKGIIPFSAEVLVKGVAENGRDKLLDVKIFFKELEEGRCVIKKMHPGSLKRYLLKKSGGI